MEYRDQYNYSIVAIVTTVKSIIVRAAENNLDAVLSGKLGRKSFFDDEKKKNYSIQQKCFHIWGHSYKTIYECNLLFTKSFQA